MAPPAGFVLLMGVEFEAVEVAEDEEGGGAVGNKAGGIREFGRQAEFMLSALKLKIVGCKKIWSIRYDTSQLNVSAIYFCCELS